MKLRRERKKRQRRLVVTDEDLRGLVSDKVCIGDPQQPQDSVDSWNTNFYLGFYFCVVVINIIYIILAFLCINTFTHWFLTSLKCLVLN